jgi:hypothetical protein
MKRIALLITVIIACFALLAVAQDTLKQKVQAESQTEKASAPVEEKSSPQAEAPASEENGEPMVLTVEADLCTGIEDHMPVGVSDTFPADVEKVYLWSRIKGATDTTMIRHIWLHNGNQMALVELPVKSPDWRTYSYKTIEPEWTGEWEVKIFGADNKVLFARSFTITPAKADTTGM